MQLTFDSLNELKDFMSWIGDLTHPVVEGPKDTIVVKDLPEPPEFLAALTPEGIEETIAAPFADKPVRKRRTKAEMEAARAAETTSGETSAATAAAEQPATSATTSADVAESASIPAVAEGSAPPVQTAAVDKGDSAEFIKSRLAERPEVSQVEHLNLARTFIGKHGMEKYNASFPLAGLTPNVMGYSPADCATHAAALDFLSME